MKEQDLMRRSTAFLRQPSHTNLTVPAPSSRKLSVADPTFPSTRKSQQFEAQNPQILQDDKYARIFKQILTDVKHTRKYHASQENQHEKERVKQSVHRTIRLYSNQKDFNERFGMKSDPRRRSLKQIKKSGHIGLTDMEKQAENNKHFFANHRKMMDLQEECMLIQYYLKDQQGQKKPFTYLKGIEPVSRHRRLTPSSKQNEQLYRTHDQTHYRSLKRRVHVKQKFVQKCSQFAKKSSSYRRHENFTGLEFIYWQHSKNIVNQTIVAPQDDEKEQQKLERNNNIMKLYLNYNFMAITSKGDQEITMKSIRKFKQDLNNIDPAFEFKQPALNKKLDSIMQYKQQKVIHFQDFKQIIIFIDNIYDKNVLSLFQQKYPSYFTRKKDHVLLTKWEQIDKHLAHHKIKFLLQVMFNTFPDQLIAHKILPIKLIPSIFKTYDINEKDYNLTNLLLNYHWVQRYDSGLTFDDFYRGSILMAMKDEDWKSIQTFLKKINLKQFV